MIRIAIVEDDELYVDQLRQYLKDYQSETGEDFEIRAYRDGDGITSDYKAQYDLILMDIRMRFVDGMTAAEEIRKMDSEVIIIFITNMAQYAIRGYEVGALDYILKPVTYFAFTQKIGRAIARLKKKIQRPVVIRTRDGVLRMDAADIYYVESQAHNLINLEHVEGVRDKCAVVKGERLLISRPRSSVFMQELTRYWSEVD